MDKKKKNDFELYKRVFDSIIDGIIITDTSLVIYEINDSAENLLKISRNKTVGKKISKLFSPEIFKLAEKSITEERTITEEEIEIGTFADQMVNIQITFSPIFSETGKVEGLLIQLKDTEAIKFLSRFTSQQTFSSSFENLILGMAHELKNPLSGIKGAAQLLNSKPSDKELNKCSDIIVKEADRLIDLLERMKKIEDFDEKSLQPFDLHEILLDIIYLESKSGSEKVKFVKNLDVAIPPVRCDENAIKQVFVNIIKNAVHAIDGSGEITITTKWVNDYKIKSKYAVLISVKDSGIGIPKEKLNKIFTPFFTTKNMGSGLGLFISNQIISKHGGAIFVESTENEGSEFKIYLPV